MKKIIDKFFGIKEEEDGGFPDLVARMNPHRPKPGEYTANEKILIILGYIPFILALILFVLFVFFALTKN